MEKYIISSYPFCAKNKWFGENNSMGVNVLVLLSFSGFKFLGEKQRTREKRKEAFIVSTNIYWVLVCCQAPGYTFCDFFYF